MPANALDSLDFQARALLLRGERQRVIAGNIANADTPGYVARDLDFASSLKAAAGQLAAASAVSTTHTGHIGSVAPGLSGGSATTSGFAAGSPMVYATPAQTNLDRNTVDMDRERAAFADNAIKYEATLRFINASVKTQLSAITGQ